MQLRLGVLNFVLSASLVFFVMSTSFFQYCFVVFFQLDL